MHDVSGNLRTKKLPDASSDWQFLTITHDNQEVSFYLNGQLLETRPFVFGSEPVEAPLWIGNTKYLSRTSFDGLIDEVMIFDRVLPAAKVREIYQAGKP